MKRLSNFLRTIDIFGVRRGLLYRGKDTYKTLYGGLFTIGYIFIFIGLFFGFGVEFYQRKSPKVVFNSERKAHIEGPVSNQNMTFAFRIEDTNGHFYENSQVLKFLIETFHYKHDSNGQWEDISTTFVEPQRCEDVVDLDKKEEKFGISLKAYYCVDFNNKTFGGYWDQSFIHGMRIITKRCLNKTETDNCLPEEDIRKEFVNDRTGSNFFFSYLYLNDVPSMNNYETPLRSSIESKYEMVNLNLIKRNIQLMKRVIIDDDKGWIFSDRTQNTIYSVGETLSDLTTKDFDEQDVIYNYLLYVSNVHETYSRSYIKIQEVIANIGGFTSFFYLTVFFVYNNFNRLLFEIESVDDFSNLTIEKSKDFMNQSVISVNRSYNRLTPTFNVERKPKDFPVIKFISSFCCSRKKNTKFEFFKRNQKVLKDSLDLKNYIHLYLEFQLLKSFLIDETQQKTLKYIDIEKFTQSDSKEENDIEKICSYLKSNRESSINKKIIAKLNPEVKKLLEMYNK